MNFKTNMNKKPKIIILIAAPLLVSILLFVQHKELYFENIFNEDQASYFTAAQDFYNLFVAHTHRCIGYPLFLGLPELFGMSPPYDYWPVILNMIFLSGILWLATKFSTKLQAPVLTFVSIGLALAPGFLRSVNLALTEIGFAFFSLLSLYSLLRYLKSEKAVTAFSFFFFLGLATLFRPGLYPFTFFALSVFLVYLIVKKKFRIQTLGFMLSGLLLTVGFQSLMMKKSHDTFRLTYIDDQTWYLYGGALVASIHQNDCFTNQCFREEQAKRLAQIDSLSLDEMSVLAKKDRKQAVFEHTPAFIKMFKINLVTNLKSGSGNKSDNKLLYQWTVFNNLFFSFVPFVLFGIFLLTSARKITTQNEFLFLIFILGFIAYTILTGGISAYQGDRFHIVFYPMALVFISYIFKQFKSAKTK
jgi:hypothetical protein